MHLHLGELGEDLGDVLEARPVELQVLARAEVAIAAVVAACDAREPAQLGRGKEAVGDRDAQHRRVPLDVEPVLQPQGAELVLGELPREVAASLVAELGDPFGDDLAVEGVVAIHATIVCGGVYS